MANLRTFVGINLYRFLCERERSGGGGNCIVGLDSLLGITFKLFYECLCGRREMQVMVVAVAVAVVAAVALGGVVGSLFYR